MNEALAWGVVRVVAPLVVLLFALSGCALPEAEPSQPLLGVCPQWQDAGWTGRGIVSLAGATGDSLVFSPDNGSLAHPAGYPLDRYRVRFTQVDIAAGTVELRAYADVADRQRGIQDYRDAQRPMSVPVLTLGPGSEVLDQEFDIFLSPVAHGTPAAPDDLRLAWSLAPWEGQNGTADIAFTVEAAYRICGAVV